MQTADFAYHLPREMIAQEPLPERDASRLLRLDRETGRFEDRTFRELPLLLRPGDLLVLNVTKVFPARLLGTREGTGGKVEALLVRPAPDDFRFSILDSGLEERGSPAGPGAVAAGPIGNRQSKIQNTRETWLAWTRSGGRLGVGERLLLAGGEVTATIRERRGEEGDLLRLECSRPLAEVLEEKGQTPVPPYIERKEKRSLPLDRERYQTVYARETGAVAAPTAGFHFTEKILQELQARGVERAEIVLHVGPGTFRPVKVERVEEHRMLPERYETSEEAAGAILRAKKEKRRVVAVGTTVVRALEAAAREEGGLSAGASETELFIRPPFEFRLVDALLTNFHLPRSTLLMLVSAFAAPGEQERGREIVLAAYRHAIEAGYRFYSYGDAMLIE